MKKIIFTIILLFAICFTYSQKVACTDLKHFIEKEGFYKSSLLSYSLDSEWLHKVTAYTYEFKTYVIAEIKRDKYSYSTKEYIFCGIPESNWSSFRYGSYGDSNSYGKRFHKYIMNYQCDCN